MEPFAVALTGNNTSDHLLEPLNMDRGTTRLKGWLWASDLAIQAPVVLDACLKLQILKVFLGVTSPFFPGILLSRKPQKDAGESVR